MGRTMDEIVPLPELIAHYEKMQASGQMEPQKCLATLSALRELELARITVATKKAAKRDKRARRTL